MILVDLGRFRGAAGLEGLTTCGGLWQPVAPCGNELHGDPTPYKQVNKKIRCIEPGGLWGVRRLVNDDKEEDWRDLPHARA